MTYKLNDVHPLDALYRACKAYPGGVEGLAARLKMQPSTLYKKLRQQVDTHHLGYDEELSEILFCLAESKVPGWDDTLHSLCWRHGLLAVQVPLAGSGHEQLTSMILTSVTDQGEVAAAISEALANDQQVDSAEFARIDMAIERSMTDMAALRELVRSMHQEALAKGLVR